MKKKLLPQGEYLAQLPRKRMGVCVLFFDESNRLLIVKPNYKEGWSVVGGTVDAEESPRDCALRETKEEIGLVIDDMQFLSIEYIGTIGESIEGLEFMFYGGILNSNQVENIVIAEDEFDAYQFMEVEKALPLLRESIRRRTLQSLEILKTGKPTYTEFRKTL